MAKIILTQVKKIYPGEVVAVEDFSLEIADREFVIFVGPSGCGKSTTLRMIAGLEDVTEGEIYIGENMVNGVPPKDRDIAMVFQSYALYPHMTVYKNMAFSLKMRKVPKDEIDRTVRATASILAIDHLLERKPRALSGGERQRVALGRAMVRSPQVFLLDEPLSNLDAKLRTDMRAEIIKLHKELATTFVYVTHDQTEAMTMGDRIVIMDKGHILQVDTPKTIYDRPANRFVAGFIGSPQMNFMEGVIRRDGASWRVSVPGAADLCLHKAALEPGALEGYLGKTVTVGIRPEHFYLGNPEEGLSFPDAVIDFTEMLGAESYVHLLEGGLKLTARVSSVVDAARGSCVTLGVMGERIHLFDADTGEAITGVPAHVSEREVAPEAEPAEDMVAAIEAAAAEAGGQGMPA